MACDYYFNGERYTEAELKKHLINGGLDDMVKRRIVDLSAIQVEKEPLLASDMSNSSILSRMIGSKNISQEAKEKFQKKLKYEVSGKEEARSIAKSIIEEYGIDDAISLAAANKFHGDVNAMVFNESLDSLYLQEISTADPNKRAAIAAKWAAVSLEYDESARSQGRFISAIGDFYRTSPLGFKIKEEKNRSEAFKSWLTARKETDLKALFEAIKADPEFSEFFGQKEVSKDKVKRAEKRKERTAAVSKSIDSAIDFLQKKLSADLPEGTQKLGAAIDQAKVFKLAGDGMKAAWKAGESINKIIQDAIDFISSKIGDKWDKDTFTKECKKAFGQEVALDRFRKKINGLSDSEQEDLVRKSFKKLVENKALEYDDFKKIVANILGLGELNEVETKKLEEYVVDINAVNDLAKEVQDKRTDEAIKKYETAAKLSEKSATKLAQIVYSKPRLVSRFTGMMQLGALGLASLVNNPVFNIVNQGLVRFPKAVMMSIADVIQKYGAKAIGKEYKPQTNVIVSQFPFWVGAKGGLKVSIDQMWNGLTNKDYFQKEVLVSQIHPFTSWKNLIDWGKGKKHLTWQQVTDNAAQGTIGVTHEVVARMLNVGDKWQRFAAEKAQAKIFAHNYGLAGMDEKIFMMFPKEEAFRIFKSQGFSEEVAMKKAEAELKKIISAGEEATFQQDNVIASALVSVGKAYDSMANKDGGNAFLQSMGKLGVVFRTMNMPFVKIPLNAYWSYFNLVNPQVAFMQSAVYGVNAGLKLAKGQDASADFEQSKKWASHGVVGVALLSIALTMVKALKIRGSNDDDETKKEREGEKSFQQQHSININGVDIDLKWFGVMGNILNLIANKQENLTPEQRKNGMELTESIMYNFNESSLEQFDNGVFGSVSSLSNAFHKGGAYADSYWMGLLNMGTNIVHPAMFSQLSRATIPYDYTTKADGFIDQIKNNMAARSSVIRGLTDHYPPSKIGIWGDPVKREVDLSSVLLRWFSMSKENKDNFAQPIYNDYLRTGDVSFFPPAVLPRMGKDKLNTEQLERLQVLVGQERRAAIAPYVNGMAYLPDEFDNMKYTDPNLSDDDKKLALDVIYKLGAKAARQKFLLIYPQFRKAVEDEDAKEARTDKKASLTEQISSILNIEEEED
jgi:hypothetical protein